MKYANFMVNFLNGISLLILDVVTLMISFSVWSLLNLPLFGWALCAILFSLILLNLMVLVSSKLIRLFGVGVYTSVIISTFNYYLFVVIFTGLTYIVISPKWYIIFILVATLFYTLTMSGLIVAGKNKNKDVERQETEKAKTLDVTLQLMNINNCINDCCNFVDQTSFTAINEAYNDMNERLKASTPFGRIGKPVVVDLENQMYLKLSEINDNIVLLKDTPENQNQCKLIVNLLNSVKTLVINREKLIIQ